MAPRCGREVCFPTSPAAAACSLTAMLTCVGLFFLDLPKQSGHFTAEHQNPTGSRSLWLKNTRGIGCPAGHLALLSYFSGTWAAQA